MSREVVLFDLANRKNVSWSINAWKARIVLNYKRIPYKTEWVEYPDVAPKFKSFGIPPNPQDDWADYTVPTVRLPDGSYVMNSISIVEKLEAMYPEPSLHLETNLHEEANTASMEVVIALLPDLQVNYLRDWLQEPSLSWFAEDRERRFGMTCEELAEQKGGNTAWPAAEAGLKKLQNLLVAHKRDEGPFLMGSTVCYGDFTIAVLFESVKRVGKSDYEKIMSYDDRFKDLHEACKPWLKRDD